MTGMFKMVKRDGLFYPSFKEIRAHRLTDDTPICTLQELIDLLGEERALNLYAQMKSHGKDEVTK